MSELRALAPVALAAAVVRERAALVGGRPRLGEGTAVLSAAPVEEADEEPPPPPRPPRRDGGFRRRRR